MKPKEGMIVKFAPKHWGVDVAKVVAVAANNVQLEDSEGNNFIRDIDEVIAEVK